MMGTTIPANYKGGSPAARIDRVAIIAEFIRQHPGQTVRQMARELGYTQAHVISTLMILDRRGMLVVEDERGGLSFLAKPSN